MNFHRQGCRCQWWRVFRFRYFWIMVTTWYQKWWLPWNPRACCVYLYFCEHCWFCNFSTLSPEKSPGSALTDQELGERFESLTGRKATSMQKSNVITLTTYIQFHYTEGFIKVTFCSMKCRELLTTSFTRIIADFFKCFSSRDMLQQYYSLRHTCNMFEIQAV